MLWRPNLEEIGQELLGKKAAGVPQWSVLTDLAPFDTSEGAPSPLGQNHTLMKELVRSTAYLLTGEPDHKRSCVPVTLTSHHHCD